MNTPRTSRVLAALVLVHCAGPGWGAARPEMSLEQKVAAADSVVRARCTSVRSEWVGKRIVTRAQFAVTNDLSQGGNRELEVTTEGGEAVHPRLGIKVRSTVSEQPTIRRDDEAILFTRKSKAGHRELVGGRQGYMLVEDQSSAPTGRGMRTQRKVVIEQDDSGQPAPRARRAAAAETLRVHTEPTPLLEYEAQVRRVIDAKPRRRSTDGGSAQQ